MIGSLYFIQEGLEGPIKIGFTTLGVERRLTYMQTGNSSPLRILGEVRGVTQLAERRWHQQFAVCHKFNEWFWPTKQLLEAIADITANPPVPRPEFLVETPDEDPREVLRDWMLAQGITTARLAELTGYTEGHIRYQTSGANWRTAPAFAVAIEEATHCAIRADEWLAWEAREHQRRQEELSDSGEAA